MHFAEINDLNTHIEAEYMQADIFLRNWSMDRFTVKIEPEGHVKQMYVGHGVYASFGNYMDCKGKLILIMISVME